MSGICSMHMGHDPDCPRCLVSSPEQAKAAQDHEESFSAGAVRGAEAVAEWLEGAQWDDDGQPCRSDAFTLIDFYAARRLARMVRDSFADGINSPVPLMSYEKAMSLPPAPPRKRSQGVK